MFRPTRNPLYIEPSSIHTASDVGNANTGDNMQQETSTDGDDDSKESEHVTSEKGEDNLSNSLHVRSEESACAAKDEESTT